MCQEGEEERQFQSELSEVSHHLLISLSCVPPPLLLSVSEVQRSSVQCVTGSSNKTGDQRVTLHYGSSQRHLHTSAYHYTHNPNITYATPAKSFLK